MQIAGQGVRFRGGADDSSFMSTPRRAFVVAFAKGREPCAALHRARLSNDGPLRDLKGAPRMWPASHKLKPPAISAFPASASVNAGYASGMLRHDTSIKPPCAALSANSCRGLASG